jgi:hypothetical protein
VEVAMRFAVILGGIAMVVLAVAQVAARPVNYWQQNVAYEIDVALDPDDHSLTGHQHLVYTNNSLDVLTYVWFHLYPNAYRDNNSLLAKDAMAMGSAGLALTGSEDRGFMEVRSVLVDGRAAATASKPGDATEMKVELPQPLRPGGRVTFDIDFYVRIPKGSGFLAQRMLRKGNHYEVTQWYPRVVVYDAAGWHPDGYRALGEFYGEFGTFDVRITVPDNMTVAATGDLVGPTSEIARMDSLARLGAKLDSLRTEDAKREIKRIHKATKKGDLSEASKTLHYHAENVHDFAWVADKDFLVKRGRYKDVTINVYTRPDCEEKAADVVAFTHDALENYSRHYGEYPYAQMSVVDGDFGGGMEYPNLTIIGIGGPFFFRLLELVVMHETGHNWFQGMLGSNEMAEVWLDEGINSFAENRYLEEKYGKVGNVTKWPRGLGFMPKLSDSYYHSFAHRLATASESECPLLYLSPDVGDEVVYFGLMYGKGAKVTGMLQYCLGDEVFDRVMQTYFEEYKFRHPTTVDFIEVAERVSGRELDWFFDQWLRTTKRCDFDIAKVERSGDTHAGGGGKPTVTVAQRGECSMPADVLVRLEDGTEIMKHWGGRGRDTTITFDTAERPAYVWIDPEDRVLELDNWNNRKPRKVSYHFIGDLPSFDAYQIFYGPSLWYDDDVDGLRPGLWLNGGEFRNLGPISSRYQWTLGASYGTESEKINYRLALSHPLRWLSGGPAFEAHLKDLEGRLNADLGLRWRWGPNAMRGPEVRLGAGLFLQNVYGLGYLEESDWSKGRVWGGFLRLAYGGNHYRVRPDCELNIKGASEALGSDLGFLKTSLTLKTRFRWIRHLSSVLRLFAGYTDGDPPLQERFYLSGGLIPEGLLGFVADGRGHMAPQNNYYVPGDANLRGYYGRHIADRVAASVGLEIPLPKIPVSLFYDLGNVWPDLDRVTWEGLRQDAGISVHLGPVTGHFPIWISDPLPGEDRVEFRWLVSTRMDITP